jgi:hypothetical protein
LFIVFTDDLLLRLDFRDPDPEVIDLSPVGSVVSTLQESKIECLSADKVRSLFFYIKNEIAAFAEHRRRMFTCTIFYYVTLADHLSSCPRLMEFEDSCR